MRCVINYLGSLCVELFTTHKLFLSVTPGMCAFDRWTIALWYVGLLGNCPVVRWTVG